MPTQEFWFTDSNNKVLRKVDSGGVITTPTLTSADAIYLADGFDSPWGGCADNAGNIFIVDEANKIVYQIDTQTLVVTRVAGGGGITGALNYTFDDPYYVVADSSGNLYVSDSGFRFGEVVLAINMQGTTQTILGVSIAAGDIAVVAGTLGVGGFAGDGGPAIAAQLSAPFGLALDGAGNLYIADQFSNQVIRKVTTAGVISTFAGTPLTPGFTGDGGAPGSAELRRPIGITIDTAGNLYVTDTFNVCVRAINMQGSPQTLLGTSVGAGDIQTVAGTPGVSGYSGDGGAATSATLGNHFGPSVFGILPWFSAVDASGNLYICDTGNFAIRMVSTAGVITTVAGTHTSGYTGDGGPATAATISQVFAVMIPTVPPPPPTPGHIITVKQTTPGGSAQSFTMNPSWGASFHLSDGQSNDSGSLAAGTYSISETAAPGWSSAGAVSNGGPINAIVLSSGATLTVTFTNTLGTINTAAKAYPWVA